MRAMRAEGFSGYQDLKLVNIPKPVVSDGRVLVRITAAGVTPLEHTILSGGYPRAKAPLVLGGERRNCLSCRFTCDVHRAVWRFREWNLQ
jgi:NADPH2:quinone reductase